MIETITSFTIEHRALLIMASAFICGVCIMYLCMSRTRKKLLEAAEQGDRSHSTAQRPAIR